MRATMHCTRLVSLLLIFVLCLAGPVQAAGSAAPRADDFDIIIRPDVRDSKNAASLAVDVVANRAGTAYLAIRQAGAAAPKRSDVLSSMNKISLEAGVEATFFAHTDAKIAAYDCYVAFKSGSAEYGPFVVKNAKNAYFPAGDGSKANPYQIWTPRHLFNISAVLSKTKPLHFKLMQNIDYTDSGYTGHAAGYASDFNGTFDGNRKTLANLEGVLFSNILEGSSVQDVRLYNPRSNGYHGIICSGTNSGTIKNIYIKGGHIAGTITADVGAVCSINQGTISGCEVQGCRVSVGSSYAGGIAGRNNVGGYVQNCFVNTSVSASFGAGGIAGHNKGIIRACAAAPSLASRGYLGGIVARNSSGSVMACASGYIPPNFINDEESGSVAGYVSTLFDAGASFGSVPISGTEASFVRFPLAERTGTASEEKKIQDYILGFDARNGTFDESKVVSTIAWTNLVWTWTYSAVLSTTWTKKLHLNESSEYIKAFPFTGFDAAGNSRVVSSTGEAGERKLTLDPSSMALKVGESKSFGIRLTPGGQMNPSAITWSSSNTGIVAISSMGSAKGVGAGTATITAKYDGLTATATVTVTKAATAPEPTAVSISPRSAKIQVGESKSFTAALTPANAKTTLRWKVSDTSLATLSSGGKLTAKKAGTVTLTCTTANGKTDSVQVTIKAKKTTYRALLLGYYEFSDTKKQPQETIGVPLSLQYLNEYLAKYTQYTRPTVKKNRTLAQTKNDIKLAFKNATENDVSLLYIGGLGNKNAAGNVTLKTSDAQYWSMKSLRAWLENIPGQVVLLFDMSYSGAVITKSFGADDEIGDAILQIFAEEGDSQARGMKGDKFRVLTSGSSNDRNKATYYDAAKGYLTVFGRALCAGLLPGGADGNSDKQISLNEMFNFVRKRGLDAGMTVGAYPEFDKATILFQLK